MRKIYISIFTAFLASSLGVNAQSLLSPRTQLLLKKGSITRSADSSTEETTAFVTLKDGKTTTVRASLATLAEMAEKGQVERIAIPGRAQQMLDVAKAETGHAEVLSGKSLSQPFTGSGVVVGIVDSGFDYCHETFCGKDGKLRIARIWEQGTKAFEGCSAPEAFGYGIEMTSEEAIRRGKADCETNSHGTHVAAIAAGSSAFLDGKYSGCAPDAEIVLVALDLNSSTLADISNGVRYIFDYAEKVGKPCVVNLSLGNHDGPHDGTSDFDRLADEMQGPGRIIVGAAGNHRQDKFHISKTFLSPDDAPLRTFISFKQKPSSADISSFVQLWAEKDMEVEVSLSAYSLFQNKEVVSETIYPIEGTKTVKLGSYATGTVEVAAEKNPNNGKLSLFLDSRISTIRNNYGVALTVKPKIAGTVDIWADNIYLALESKDIEGFTAPTSESTIAEVGGTGKRIVTAGAYVTRTEYNSSVLPNETLGALGSFSSCGPTADGRTKPEITAPGCFIVSAVSSFDTSGTKIPAVSNEASERVYEYGYQMGTSMAAPFVAGVVATMLQAAPQLSPEVVKDILSSSARSDSFAASLPNNSWGYGKIDALAALSRALELSDIRNVTNDNVLMPALTVNKDMLSLSFLAEAANVSISLRSADGTSLSSLRLSNVPAGTSQSIPLSSLPSGVYLLTISSGSNVKTVKFGK